MGPLLGHLVGWASRCHPLFLSMGAKNRATDLQVSVARISEAGNVSAARLGVKTLKSYRVGHTAKVALYNARILIRISAL